MPDRLIQIILLHLINSIMPDRAVLSHTFCSISLYNITPDRSIKNGVGPSHIQHYARQCCSISYTALRQTVLFHLIYSIMPDSVVPSHIQHYARQCCSISYTALWQTVLFHLIYSIMPDNVVPSHIQHYGRQFLPARLEQTFCSISLYNITRDRSIKMVLAHLIYSIMPDSVVPYHTQHYARQCCSFSYTALRQTVLLHFIHSIMPDRVVPSHIQYYAR